MKLKVLELFGGIGACSKALERLGIDYEIADYVEIDKYAVKSYNAIHNTNFEPQDITQWDKDIEVDLVMHGSPCQDFSLAGLQAGGDEGSGTRSSLMYETIRIVNKLKPKYVVWENVKNLLSKKHRHNFDSYLEIMESLGYKNYYQVLNAKDYGIPQNRERVFTISILNDDNYVFPKGIENTNKIIEHNPDGRHQQDLIQDEEGLCRCIPAGTHGSTPHLLKTVVRNYIFPEKQELKLKLKDMLEDEVDEKYYLSKEKISKIAHWKGFQKPFEKVQGNNSIVPTLTARGAGEEHNGMITYSGQLEDTANLQNECLEIGLFDDTSSENFAKGKRDYGYSDKYGTLKCNPKYSIYKSTNLKIRKLTPKECWRLMGFDDEDFEKAQQVNSSTQLYKQAGNSIVVNVLMAIFEELFNCGENNNE